MENKCCLRCDYARDVPEENLKKGFVGCAYHTRERDDGNKNSCNCITGDVYEGWIYGGRRPYSTIKNPTVSEGLMTNYCIVVEQDACCEKFELSSTYIWNEICKNKHQKQNNDSTIMMRDLEKLTGQKWGIE